MSYDGLVNGDYATNVYTGSASASTTADASSGVGSYDITVAPGTLVVTNANYSLVLSNGVLTVDAKALNIAANADSKTYGQVKTYGAGQTAFSTGAGELVNGDTVTSVTLACADGGPASAIVGSYHIIASAAVGSGLGNYSISYHDGTLTVTAANSATALVSSENPSMQGSNVTFTATVTPVAPATTTPTGSVQFYTNGVVCSSPRPLSGGVASITVALFEIGNNDVEVTYLPDSNFLGSIDDLVQLVNVTPQTPITVGIENNGDGSVTVSLSGTPGAQYIVQAKSDLGSATVWESVSTNTAGTDGKWTFTECTGDHAVRFCRSVIP